MSSDRYLKHCSDQYLENCSDQYLKQSSNSINCANPGDPTFVVTSTDDNGPGSLRAAIAAANPGDTIVFAVTGFITLSSQIVINKSLTINGPGPEVLAISGVGRTRIFDITGGGVTVTIRAISLINGLSSGNSNPGGAIYNEGSSLIVRSCTFSGNNAPDSFGGAIANNFSGKVDISNSTFTMNHARFSGAIGNASGIVNLTNSILTFNSADVNGGAMANDGTAEITNTMFSSNSAGNNGGAFANDGIAVITNSIFSTNTAANGGAVSNDFNSSTGVIATITILRSTFSNNNATNGGAVVNIGSVPNTILITIQNSTFSNNTAANGGAVANIDSGTIIITRSTFIDNSASNSGGAIYNNPSGTVNVDQSTFINNTAPDGAIEGPVNITRSNFM